jgi:hypothetical protein
LGATAHFSIGGPENASTRQDHLVLESIRDFSIIPGLENALVGVRLFTKRTQAHPNLLI